MKVIREMLHKVEVEQQAHLDQLSKMEEQTKYVIHVHVHVTCASTCTCVELVHVRVRSYMYIQDRP